MSKNKSKQKQNAFFFFMLDWKKDEEKKGRKFPNGLRDVQADYKCNDTWKNLSDERRAYYKEKERNSKFQVQVEKKTAIGELLNDVQRSEMKQKEFQDNMIEDITSTIKEAYENNDLEQLKFYVVHINYFYSRFPEGGDIEYFPAEIALAEFSLAEGVSRTYEKIVNSRIHTGYASAAMVHSQNTHQISKNPEFGESNYKTLYKEICEFLDPGRINGKLPPLYTLYHVEDVKNPVISVLQTLADFDSNFVEKFTVYSFEELFVNLRNINIKNVDDIVLFNNFTASLKLKEDPFDYKTSLRCKYHSEISAGGNYCSRSFVQRWIFVMFSYCCPAFNIKLQPGSHTPKENRHDEEDTLLLNSFEGLSLCKPVISAGAIKSPIKHVSERTYKEELRRRSESMAQPLMIIDHSKSTIQTDQSQPLERPLRRPFTKPSTLSEDEDSNRIGVDDINKFPSIGRGARIKTQHYSPKSVDYASRLK